MPRKDPKAFRAALKAAGLCIHCSKPALPGKTRCQTHADYRAPEPKPIIVRDGVRYG